MTPAERAVIQAARVLYEEGQNDHWTACAVVVAVQRLMDAEVSGEPQETPVTYGQVVAGDQLQNRQTKAWHEVLENNVRDNQAHIRLRGVAKPFSKPAGESVTVLRSAMGRAVDMFNIDWSGPNGEKS